MTLTDTTYWLIERGQPEGFDPPRWWAWYGRWEADASRAEKFVSRASAEGFIASEFIPQARATEHMFVSQAPFGDVNG